MTLFRCSICGKQFDPADSSAMPFCSERCRMVDLGQWLDEGYGMSRDSEDGEPREDFDPGDE